MEKLKPSSANVLLDGNHHRRRLVLYIGPPKTGSTTLQTFLAMYANRDSNSAANTMKDWNYPMFFGVRDGIKRSIVNDSAVQKRVENEFRRHQSSALNLVVASEFLLMRSNQYKQFAEWSNVTTPEIVIHSRTPRFAHLQSMWKQQTQGSTKKVWYGWSFRNFICSKFATDFLSAKMSTTLDPIGRAHSILHELKLPVYMMNMAGVEEQGMDISHAFACTILQVNCTTDGNKWVVGIPRTPVRANARSGEAGITKEQIDRIDNVFRQRDCAYGDDVYKHPLFRLFYETSETWPHDCSSNVQVMPTYRQKPSLILEEIRQIMQCRHHPSSSNVETAIKEDSAKVVEIQVPMNNLSHLILLAIVLFLVFRKLLARRFR
eukprot:scaffold766_cov57-Cylindrotheca_fusiformis.AAC.3